MSLNRGGEFFGVGLGARGFVNGFYYRNHIDPARYFAAVRASGWGTDLCSRLSSDQVVRRQILFGLRGAEGVPLELIRRASPAVQAEIQERIDRQMACGLLTLQGERLRLSRPGRFFPDDVAFALASSEDDRRGIAADREPTLV